MPGLGATIAFFIGASIALETTSVKRQRGAVRVAGRRILQCRADAADYTHRLEIEFPAMLRHCLLQHSYPQLFHRPIRFFSLQPICHPLLMFLYALFNVILIVRLFPPTNKFIIFDSYS